MTKAENEWVDPWLKLLRLINFLVRDEVGALAIILIAHGLEVSISLVEGNGWGFKAGSVEITPADIVHNVDLCTLVVYIVIGGYNVVRRIARDE